MSPHDINGMVRPQDSNGSASSTLERMSSLEADSPDANSEMCNRAVQRHKAQLKTDAQLAAAAPDDEAKRQLTECYESGGSCNELLATVCRVYGERNVFGLQRRRRRGVQLHHIRTAVGAHRDACDRCVCRIRYECDCKGLTLCMSSLHLSSAMWPFPWCYAYIFRHAGDCLVCHTRWVCSSHVWWRQALLRRTC